MCIRDRIPAVHVAQHVLVRDKFRRVREHGAPLDMIEVAVAVETVADGNLEALGELVFQPGRQRHIDRITEDDAVRRDVKHRCPCPVAHAVEIAGNVGDVARRAARALRRDRIVASGVSPKLVVSGFSRTKQSCGKHDKDQRACGRLHRASPWTDLTSCRSTSSLTASTISSGSSNCTQWLLRLAITWRASADRDAVSYTHLRA